MVVMFELPNASLSNDLLLLDTCGIRYVILLDTYGIRYIIVLDTYGIRYIILLDTYGIRYVILSFFDHALVQQ